ncbi:YlxR family protein [Propionibacteriaceae bacterium Y1685]
MTEPVRTCIGCRGRAGRSTLLRLVHDADADLVRLDERKAAPGRGAHLHDDPDCFALAVRRRAIGRALRLTSQVVVADELRERFDVADI